MNATALALLTMGTILGQGTPDASDIRSTKERGLSFGIEYTPERRKEIEYTQLFVSKDQGQTWQLADTANPSQTQLKFQAKQDGLYYFNMVILHRDGSKHPANVYQQKPKFIYIIDSTAPKVQITQAQSMGDQVTVEWAIDDEFPNDKVTQLYYGAAGPETPNWVPVPSANIRGRKATFAANVTGPILVQVVTADMAENVGHDTREVLASTSTNYPPTTAKPVETSPLVGRPGSTSSEAPLPPPNLTPSLPATEPPKLVAAPANPPAITPPIVEQIRPEPIAPLQATPLATRSEQSMERIAMGSGLPTDPRPQTTTSNARPALPPEASPTAQLVRYPRFDMNYQLDGGPSGIARLDLYVTRDDGRTWVRWSTHDGKETTLRIRLDMPFNQDLEGEYGFLLIPVSGAGLSVGAPKAGVAPEMKVHLDVSAPTIEVYQPIADPNQRNTLVLRWVASDKNFGPEPLMVEYSETANGPWKSVTADEAITQVAMNAAKSGRIANTGTYAWNLPNTLANPKVYLRFTAWDLAGNKSEVTTPNPILVDLTKPTARIQGIIPVPSGK